MPSLTATFGNKFLAVAHRGYPTVAPENTIISFEKAAATGIGLIELDVQLTGDGVPVVIHDPTLERTTDGNGRVSDFTAAEIGRLDAGSWFGPEFKGERVPTLAEALDWAKGGGRVGLVIELKNDGYSVDEMDRMVKATLKSVTAAGMTDRVALISFDHRAVGMMERSGAMVLTGCLIMPNGAGVRHRAEDLIRIAHQSGSRLVLPFHNLTDRPLVSRLIDEGFRIVTWTADSESDILKQLDYGVSGLASNDPGLLVSVLRSADIRFR